LTRAFGEFLTYHNFIGVIENEFTPVVDWENTDAQWFDLGKLPDDRHFGLNLVLDNDFNVIQDVIISAMAKKMMEFSSNFNNHVDFF
jgi:hypothetical protein